MHKDKEYICSFLFVFSWRTTTTLLGQVAFTVPNMGALALLLRSSCVTKSTQHSVQQENKTRGKKLSLE